MVCAALAIIGLVAVAVWPGEREPEYQGKKLSEWVRAYVKAEHAFSEAEFGYTYYQVRTNRELQALRAEANNAHDVVIRLGTNSIPWLIRRVEYETPIWRKK